MKKTNETAKIFKLGYGLKVKKYKDFQMLYFGSIPLLKKNYIQSKSEIINKLGCWFFEKTGNPLDLKNPKTYNEKIQWMKIYDSTKLKTKLTDKYEVRNWVKNKIGEKYLIPLIGMWENFSDINFDEFPKSFVLKATHGCAMNIIVKDKTIFNEKEAKIKFEKWLNTNFAYQYGYEMQYDKIPPRIIAEKYIGNGIDDIVDYKIWCFGGKAYYIQHLSERSSGLKMAFYDTNWIKQDFVYSYELNENTIKKPEKLDEMIKIAETLSKGFTHVRVDLYLDNEEEIKFGEMTFTSCSGVCKWNNSDINLKLGDLIKL